METMQWEVIYHTPPKSLHYCKKCGCKTEYHSSGRFRVNANQKLLDIWLIYQCAACQNTWNMTIYSRINPKSIPVSKLEQFMKNDDALALSYAMDSELLKQSGCETKIPEFSVYGFTIDVMKITAPVRIEILSSYEVKIKIAAVLRQKLGLSNKVFDELVSQGFLRMENGTDIRTCKLRNKTVVLIGTTP